MDALTNPLHEPDFPHRDKRAFLLLSEMTSKGSFATGAYTEKCIELARANPKAVVGLLATHSLTDMLPGDATNGEDFVIFTTGVNMASKRDKLGQQYQTPEEAIGRGGDFIVSGRGIYTAPDPVESAKQYQKAGWDAYLKRVGAGK